MTSRHLPLALALLAAPAAHAFSSGQYGFSGEENSCLACHGTNTYAGITLTHDGAETTVCTPSAGDAYEIPVVKYGESIKFTLTIKKPADGEVTCPTTGCAVADCADEAGECYDLYIRNDGQCPTSLTSCGTPVAGFNASIRGGGTFESVEGDDKTRVLVMGGVMDPDTGETVPVEPSTEITHRAPRPLADGDGVYEFVYKAPKHFGERGARPSEIFVGANVANNNGWADKSDLNTNLVTGVALLDPALNTVIMPPSCGACEGGAAPDATGACPACACTAVPSSGGGLLGGAAIVALALLARRRR